MTIRDEELDQAFEELGISGDEIGALYELGALEDDEDDDEVGARVKKALRKVRRNQRVRVMATRSGRGDKATVIVPATANLTLAAAGVGSLVFTAQDKVEIVDCVLDVYVAAAVTTAAMFPAALSITAITVATRTIFKGAGVAPSSIFGPNRDPRVSKFLQWGALDNGQSVTISFQNNDAATTHNLAGCLLCWGGV